MRLALIAAALLAGCAAPVPAERVSNVDLCRYQLYGNENDKAVSQREAQRRGLDCAPIYPSLVQQRAAQDAALNNAAQYFNRPVQPMPFPQQTNCTSRVVGGSVQTSCW